MSKNLILFISLFMFCSLSQAQSETDRHQLQKGDFLFSPRAGYLDLEGYEPRFYGGFDIDWMANDRVGFHYSLLFGEKYFQMPVSPIVGIFVGYKVGEWSNSSSDGGPIALGLLAFVLTSIIPESVSYNIPMNDKTSIAPYISPIQLEYISSTRGQQDTFAAGALGVRLNHYKNADKNWGVVSPYLEYKVHYNENLHPGFSGGIRISRFIGNNNREPRAVQNSN